MFCPNAPGFDPEPPGQVLDFQLLFQSQYMHDYLKYNTAKDYFIQG